MKNIIEIYNKQPMTDSRVVAKKFGKRHDDVLKAIQNLDCSDEFSLRNFAESIYVHRGKEYPKFYITRDGFSFLCMGFTGKRAAQWKEKYIGAFNLMEHQLLQVQLNKSDPQWVTQREQTKALHHDTTDIIKQFVDYATSQGSTSASWYYKSLTNATYKSLGLLVNKQPKIRNTLDSLQLSWLMAAESVVQQTLLKYMEQGMYYKDIFKQTAKDVTNWAEPLLLIDFKKRH